MGKKQNNVDIKLINIPQEINNDDFRREFRQELRSEIKSFGIDSIDKIQCRFLSSSDVI